MALNATIVYATQPAATGNQTYNLAADFDPKAVIAVTVVRTASGGGAAHANLCVGWGTYRGATAQQYWLTSTSEDALASSDTYGGHNTDAILKTSNGTDAVVDLAISLVSMATGASSSFTVNWSNLHTTASIRVAFIVLGGSDLTDALASSFTTQTTPATQDVTVTTGFGQPSAILFGNRDSALSASIGNRFNTALGFGVNSASTNGRGFYANSNDSAATQATTVIPSNNAAIRTSGSGTTVASGFGMSAVSGWPTDGFEVTYSAQTAAVVCGYLALKFSANITVAHGEGSAPTSGATPVTQTVTASGTPRLALLLGMRNTAAQANAVDSTSVDDFQVGLGAIDGAGLEMFSAVSDADNQSTSSITGTYWSEAKSIQFWDPVARTITSEADGSVSGSNFQLSWNDIDATAFLYEYLTFSEPAAAAAAPPPPVTVINQAALVRAHSW